MRGAASVDPSRGASGRPGGRRFTALGRALERVLLTVPASDAAGPRFPPSTDAAECSLRCGAVAATPAVRILERGGVAHTLHPYDAEHPADQGHGEAAVAALGADPRQVFKT